MIIFDNTISGSLYVGNSAALINKMGASWRLVMFGTFARLVLLSLIVLVECTGCAMRKSVSDEQYNQAVQLVDQGVKLLRAQQFREAKVAFATAEELAPIAAAVDGLGCVALLEGDYKGAEKLFNRAYDMDATYDTALGNLALLMDITGRHERAKELYDTVIKKIPDNIGARNNRAALEYDRGERKIVVIEELEKAKLIAKHPVITENLNRLKSKEG
jgi:Flp pilus assembly protein TadD